MGRASSDEMQLDLVRMLLGGGGRLFANVDGLHGLVPVETVAAPNATHPGFSRA
jgi:hypothetical protein